MVTGKVSALFDSPPSAPSWTNDGAYETSWLKSPGRIWAISRRVECDGRKAPAIKHLMKPLEINDVRNFASIQFSENLYNSYQLFFNLPSGQNIAVGKLGRFKFPAGTYVYTGSAKRNIKSRIARHISADKKLKWHIDYLLSEGGVTIYQVKLFSKTECELNKEADGIIVVPRFGSTDCRSNCISHLKLLRNI